MGPKTFTACYVCFKEFGSKSITFHEPRCLERWRSSNKSLPAEKRTPTPVKPSGKNTDSNQNNTSWVCSHCQPKVSSANKSEDKLKSNSNNLRADCVDQNKPSCNIKQTHLDCVDKLKSRRNSPKKIHADCVEQNNTSCNPKHSDCVDKLQTSRNSPKQIHADCVEQNNTSCNLKHSDCVDKLKSRRNSPKKIHADCVEQNNTSCNLKHSDCVDKLQSSRNSPKQIHADCVDQNNTSYNLKHSDCVDKLKSSRNSPKQIHTDCVDKPKSSNNLSKQTRPDCVDKLKSSNNNTNSMTGVVKADFSPKKGKENKNSSNQIPPPSVLRKNAKNEAKMDGKEVLESVKKDANDPTSRQVVEAVGQSEKEDVGSTSKRSVRPQTKILRRPTPNLKHPVIQVDSDDSSGDSSCSSDKSKDDNPKRLKMGSESSDSAHKPKNFIMYNKNNVDRKMKQVVKERASATMTSLIPNPCNSCNRSMAPERLHSHAKKDSRGLMYRKSPTLDVKMTSPLKKVVPEISEKAKMASKDLKTAQAKAVAHQADSLCDSNAKTKSPCAVPLGKSCSSTELCSEESCSSTELCSEESCSSAELCIDEKELVDLVKSCYICQKEFKVSALRLHESKCLESWKRTNNSLTPNLRKLPPQRPDDEDDLPPDEADPAWTSVQSQLVPCSVCGRTFFPERLPVHRRVCKGKPSPRPLKRASSLREQSASSRDGEDPRPAAIYVPCYVCGRNYGSWVISMHEQQCLRKWRGENEKLPYSEQQEEPKKFPERSEDDDVASLIELGDNAWESHLQQLVPCPLCARTFFPDRLGVHKRSCKGPTTGSRRPRSNKGA